MLFMFYGGSGATALGFSPYTSNAALNLPTIHANAKAATSLRVQNNAVDCSWCDFTACIDNRP
jgi:hypothetical protein